MSGSALSPNWQSQLGLLAALFLILGGTGLIASLLWMVPPVGSTQYVLVIDAGSSGSRIYLFHYQTRYTESLPSLNPVRNSSTGVALVYKTFPGLASFVSNTTAAGVSLEPLIAFAVAHMPSEHLASSPLFLSATAGMRLLNQENATAAEAIMLSVRQYLHTTPFQFNDTFARTIPGNEEAVNGWLAVNELLQNFNPPADPAQTVGSVEIGGASAQVAFVAGSPVPSSLTANYTYNVSQVADTNYTVYVHSYLEYGAVEARYRVNNSLLVQQLAVNSSEPLVVQHPCFNAGFMEQVQTLVNGDPQKPVNYTLLGTGNYSQCSAGIVPLFQNRSMCVLPNPANCTFDGVYQPPLSGVFRGLDNVILSFAFFNLSANASLEQLVRAATPFCALSWAEAQQRHPDVPLDVCYKAAYVPQFLVAVGFSLSEHGVLQSSQYVDRTEVSWPVGAAASAVAALPWTPTRVMLFLRYPYALPVSLVLLAVAIVVLALIFFLARRELHDYERLPEEPIE